MSGRVLAAAASDQPALISIAEGFALAVLFAASHPSLFGRSC